MSTSSSQILLHTTAFLSDVVTHSDRRRRLTSTLLHHTPIPNQITLKQLNLASTTFDNAISLSNPTIRSSSLSLAEKLLLSLPPSPFSSFLLSLIHSLNNQHLQAAFNLLHVFYLSPNLARSEIAPFLYDHLFSPHLLPVFRSFHDQRATILPSTSAVEDSLVFPPTKLLSRMTDQQASRLRELERDYEEAIDDNCRIVAEYFKEVLLSHTGESSISPPSSVLKNCRDDAEMEHGREEMEETNVPLFKNGRYNVMLCFRYIFLTCHIYIYI